MKISVPEVLSLDPVLLRMLTFRYCSLRKCGTAKPPRCISSKVGILLRIRARDFADNRAGLEEESLKILRLLKLSFLDVILSIPRSRNSTETEERLNSRSWTFSNASARATAPSTAIDQHSDKVSDLR